MKGRNYLANVYVNWRIILKRIFKKNGVGILCKLGASSSSCGLMACFGNSVINHTSFITNWEPAERLVAFEGNSV
jgi:hypothetical protein